MIDKKINYEKALEVKDIALKYGLNDLAKDMDAFILRNENYKAHILMIGGYSAGKSALLNKYIGKKVLKENQGPETDIATELHFCENERILLKLMDGSEKEISSVETIDINEAINVKYYLDSENIKTQCDYIMVDTPGFDSGIENHNKALMKYIDRGTAFFLVVDCEKGTISESTLKFIDEVISYSSDIAIIINKCDKRIAKEVEEVKQHIKELLFATTGGSFPIICTSIFDEDVAIKIKGLIDEFNPEYLYDKNITSELDRKKEFAVQALELTRENASCDTTEIESEIKKRNDVRKKLLEQIELQKKKTGDKIHNEIKSKIISKIHSQLMNNAEDIARAYRCGIDIFREKVVEIIRPIIILEVEDYSSVAYEDFVKNLDYNVLSSPSKTDETKELIENVYEKLMGLNNGELLLLNNNNKSMDGKIIERGLNIYRGVSTALAITTSVVAPYLEIVIVFLPEIIKLANIITGNTEEQQLVGEIQGKVIPEIVSKIKLELGKSLNEVEAVMAENIAANVKEILDIENDALQAAINKKNELEGNYSDFILSIDSDIESLRK